MTAKYDCKTPIGDKNNLPCVPLWAYNEEEKEKLPIDIIGSNADSVPLELD